MATDGKGVAPVRVPGQAPVKPAGGTAPAQKTRTATRTFVKEKDTKNTVRYSEAPLEGEPLILGAIYVQKWFAQTAETLELDIRVK